LDANAALAESDTLNATRIIDDDIVYGGADSDIILGGAGDDLILGDGQYSTLSSAIALSYAAGSTLSYAHKHKALASHH